MTGLREKYGGSSFTHVANQRILQDLAKKEEQDLYGVDKPKPSSIDAVRVPYFGLFIQKYYKRKAQQH